MNPRSLFLASSGFSNPAFKSASIAICFPGIASKVNLADTSETLPAPLVTTTKLIMIKIANTNIPTKLEISVSKIDLNPFQPRSSFKKEKLNELISSIRNIGLIQPVTVKIISKGKYQLISGERRLRAFKKLKIKKIPCFIRNAVSYTHLPSPRD